MYSLIKEKYNTIPLMFVRLNKPYSGSNGMSNPLLILNNASWYTIEYVNNEFIEIHSSNTYFFKKNIVVSVDFYLEVSSDISNTVIFSITNIYYQKIVYGGNKVQTVVSTPLTYYPLQTNDRIFVVPADYTFCIAPEINSTLKVNALSNNYMAIYLIQ